MRAYRLTAGGVGLRCEVWRLSGIIWGRFRVPRAEFRASKWSEISFGYQHLGFQGAALGMRATYGHHRDASCIRVRF